MHELNKYIVNALCTFGLALTIPVVLIKLFYKFSAKASLNELSGKVVLITGASSGLGEALAEQFYKRGCRVVLCARRMDELERVKRNLVENHSSVDAPEPLLYHLDLSDVDNIVVCAREILSKVGHIDILINNSGISHRGSVLSTSPDVDIKIMSVNYFGAVALTKALLPTMVERKQGHIVSISSIQGLVALPHRSAYCASKHALQAFSDSLRAEVAENNIFVTVISAGYIQTNLSLNALTGSGTAHGKMDKSTEQGYKAEYVAERILIAVARKEKEVIISTILPKVAIFLRKYLPSLYFIAMAKRAKTA